jgi:hypothetical protein
VASLSRPLGSNPSRAMLQDALIFLILKKDYEAITTTPDSIFG